MNVEQPLLDFTSISSVLTESVDICANRHRGNQESAEAHERIVQYKAEKYDKIIKLILKHGPLTVHSIAYWMGYGDAINRVSGRLSELKMLNLIYKVGKAKGSAVLDVDREELQKQGLGHILRLTKSV